MEFSKLDQHIKDAFKEIFIVKKIYMGRPSGYINQRLVHLIINEQVLIWDKNSFCKYKKIYSMSKASILLKSKFDSLVVQQFTPSIEAKINCMNN